MATVIKRTGFGQVEPNHLSAQITGQLYAQLPAHIKSEATDATAKQKADTIEILENGQFAKYDYAASTEVGIKGEVNFTGEGEWLMVFNEVKLYDTWRETYKDFAMINTNYTNKIMTPRLIKTNVGDIFTTNCVGAGNTSGKTDYAGISLSVGDLLQPTQASKGILVKVVTGTPGTGEVGVTDGDPLFQVVKETTMPDGQPAVKVMRIK